MLGVTHLGRLYEPESLLAWPESQSSCCEKAQAVWRACVDLLVLIWYALQHAANYFLTISPCLARRVFKGEVICHTKNQAKFTDLPHYVAWWRNQPKVGPEALRVASVAGLSVKSTKFYPKPYSGGHCFGNVTHFIKRWFETEDIETVAKEFKGGSAFEGAIFQEAYENLYLDLYDEDLFNLIDACIIRYPLISMSEERLKWRKTCPNALPVLDALESYLSERRHPKKGEFVEYICDWVYVETGNLLGSDVLCSVYAVAEKYEKQQLMEKARMHAAFSNAGLRVKKFNHMDVEPFVILNTMATLPSGAYKLSFPDYSSTGEIQGCHCIALIVDNSDNCYILDSNIAIGSFKRDKLQETIGRILTEYTGFDFSEDLQGKYPSFWTRTGNLMRESANPPESPSLIKCQLMEITVGSQQLRQDTSHEVR